MKVKMNFFALTVLVATAVIGHCAENAPAVDGAAALTEVQTKNALTNGPKSQIDIKDEAALVKSTRVALNYVREALAAAPGVIAKTHPPENRTATQENPVVVSLQTALNATQAALEAAQKAEQTKPGHIVAPGAPAQPGAPKESVFTGISEQLKTARESALAARTATLKQIKERSGGSEEVNAKENTTQYDLAIESSRQNIFVDQIQLAQDALYSASLIAQIRHHRFIGGEANNRNADFLVVVLENTWWAQDANERAKLQSEERVAFYAKAKELDKQIQQSNARMKDQDAAVKKALDESTKLLEQRKAEKKNGDKNPKEMR
jgi:nicotinamide riboside kinase